MLASTAMIKPIALSTMLVALAACGKKSTDETKPPAPVAAVAPAPAPAPAPAAKPGEAEPAEPVYKPACARMLPKELVDKAFAGMTVKTTTETGERAECALQKAGTDAIAVAYDCSAAVRAAGPGGFMQDRDAVKGATEVPKLGFAAYQFDARAFRVLGDDAPCRIEVRWPDKAPANAVELVRAVVGGATMAALK